MKNHEILEIENQKQTKKNVRLHPLRRRQKSERHQIRPHQRRMGRTTKNRSQSRSLSPPKLPNPEKNHGSPQRLLPKKQTDKRNSKSNSKTFENIAEATAPYWAKAIGAHPCKRTESSRTATSEAYAPSGKIARAGTKPSQVKSDTYTPKAQASCVVVFVTDKPQTHSEVACRPEGKTSCGARAPRPVRLA